VRNYPELRRELQELAGKLRKDIPEQMAGFAGLHKAALADGALARKTKELIALGIAIAARCDGCIAYHVHSALKAGASRQEITEAIGVAMLMGGGPAMVYGCEGLAALEQFQQADS
jgi:AhpD family alkylhydroperoxidase